MTREDIIERSQSEKHDYPDVFTDKTGLDLQPIHSGVKAVPAWGDKREAVLTISTFVGDYNARHYYADIAIDGVLWEYEQEPGSYSIVTGDCAPLAEEMYWLKLYRSVNEKEKKHDAARWAFYEVGDLTTRFDTMQEIFELAKLVFDTRFEGEWVFKVQTPFKSSTGDFNEIYGRINKKDKDENGK